MQGAVDRTDIYKSVELSLDRLISDHLNDVLAAGREIRRVEIGEDAAVDEERRGNIPDEEYAKDAAVRREARERQKKQDETRKRREEEKEQLRAEALQKEAELDRLRRADERRRERKARDEQLQAERKKRAEEDAERRRRDHELREEKAGRDSSLQRPKEESRSGQRSIERVQAADKGSSRSPHPLKEEESVVTSNTMPAIDEKAIEAAALEELLREGRENAAKSGSKILLERSESLERPHRKSHMLKPKSSNISPHKSVDPRPPMKSEPVKAKLSFSAINVGRDAVTQREPPAFQRTRSRSPTASHRNPPDNRSRSPPRNHQGEEYTRIQGPEDRYHHKPPVTSRRGPEADYPKRDIREASHHSLQPNREETRDKESKRQYHREGTHDRDDGSKHHHRDHNEAMHQATQDIRSASHGNRDRDRDRDYDRDRGRHRGDYERGSCREGRDRRYDRSRSPHKSSDHKQRYDDVSSVRSGHRTKSPVEIDRYVPGGGSQAKDVEKDKYRHRDRDADLREERHKHRDRDSRDERQSDRDREKDGREDGRYRDRRDDRDEYRSRHGERDRDRDRERGEKSRGYERDRGADGRDRRGDKERRDDGHDRDRDRDRGKGYVDIDRYVPGGREDLQRARGRDRSR